MKFSNEHEWATIEGNTATIGISKYAIAQLGDITFIELPEIGAIVSANDSIAFIESVKAASDIYSPMSGTVSEINEALSDTPEVLNEDAQAHWIYKITISDPSEEGKLMNEADYEKFISTL